MELDIKVQTSKGFCKENKDFRIHVIRDVLKNLLLVNLVMICNQFEAHRRKILVVMKKIAKEGNMLIQRGFYQVWVTFVEYIRIQNIL